LRFELDHFRRLGPAATRLLQAIVLFILAGPLVNLFVNAFLWRTTHDIQLVAIYNLTIFAGLPVGFYLTGHLLRRFLTTHLYLAGCITQGCILSSLILFSHPSFPFIIIYGSVFGIALGIYWSNRNLLTLLLTSSSNRIYFSSLEQGFGIILGIIVPLIAGFFITFADSHHLPSYPLLFSVTVIIIVLSGFSLARVPIEKTPVPRITLSYASKTWNMSRALICTRGLVDGVSVFLPTLMILTFLGKEDKLGIIQSLASFLSIVVLYAVAKKAKTHHRLLILTGSIITFLCGTIFFSLTYSAIGVLGFFAFESFYDPFFWVAIESLNYDLINLEESKHPDCHYSYIFDQELYLNIGRVSAIILFVAIVNLISARFAIQFSMLIFACTQIMALFLAKRIDRNVRSSLKEHYHMEKSNI